MPMKMADLPDSAVEEPLKKFIASLNGPAHTEWDLVRTDLNNDGRRDAIVLFKLPHHYWCGWDGCGMLVLQATDKTFTPITAVNNVRGPIFVSNQETNQWRDIILRISGTNIRDKNIVMQFNGASYPSTPMLGQDLQVPLSVLETERYFL